VLVAFAVTESSPSQIKAGKETRVPPPATELIAPARNAAPKATAAWGMSSAEVNFEDTAGRRSALKISIRPSDFAV